MKTIFFTGFMVVLWAVNLLNGTGLGQAYHTTEYARVAALLVGCWLLYRDNQKRRGWHMPARYFFVLLPLLTVFILVSLFNNAGWVGLEYMWVFLVVFILSHTRPDRSTLYLVGIAYAVLGLAILVIFNYFSVLKGWNSNSIAMIGLFSYMVFTIPFYGVRDKKSVFMLLLVGLVYTVLLWPINSRSCIMAIALAWLVVFHVLPLEKIFRSPVMLFLALQIPLVIAIIGSQVALHGDVTLLNTWSLEEVGKPFFNGRDELWLDAFRTLDKNFLFGTGDIEGQSYHHNSAVDCLAAYGVVGYALWITLFHTILKEALPYRRDICVGGALAAFLVIFWQQSVERGMLAAGPNLIPYVILGLLLARTRAVKEQEC